MPTKGFVTVAAALLLPAAAGCIRMEHALQLREDGSGRYTVSYVAPESTLNRIRAMRKLRQDLAKAEGDPPAVAGAHTFTEIFLDGTEEEIRGFVQRFADYGLDVVSLDVDVRNARRIFKMETEFSDIGTLAESAFFRENGFSLTRNREGNYVLYRAAPLGTNDPTLDLSNPEQAKQVAPFLAGFQTKIRVTVPGRILKSNAPATSMQSSIWTFDFDQNPESYGDLLTKGMGIIFEGRDLTLPEIRRDAERRQP